MSHLSTRRRARRGRRLAAAVAAAMVIAAMILITVATRAQVHAEPPAPSAAHPAAEGNLPAPAHTDPATGQPATPTPSIVGPTLPRSRPVALSIPAIGIHHTKLDAYGTTTHGAIAIPPATGGVPAGWYTGSPTPGQAGPSVIVGHIDSAADGPSIFFHLSKLTPGDKVYITRTDHTTAVFRVDSLEEYPKKHFPTQKVYGNINHAGLRLITCGGQFDPNWGHYLKNTVVYAHLISSHHA